MVAESGARMLDDTSYDRLRTPRALRAVAAVYVSVTVAVPLCWILGGSIVGVLAVFGVVGVYLWLRVAVRSAADLPDHVLDERMRRDRDSVYVDAFRLVAIVVFLGANAALLPVAFSDRATIEFGYEEVSAVYWTVFALLLGAPSLVLAVRQSRR
ncbi:MAG: hypothetical protein ACKVWR_02005 [Acidimicrobiales bacterium]